jgi:glycosyltransferase involved in cell wall biosynthesis
MRILFVSAQPHLPDLRSGLQTTTHDLCLTLRDIGAEPAVLCGRTTEGRDRNPSRSWEIDESLGYPVIRADTPEHQVTAVATAWNAAAVVTQVGPRFLPLLVASLDSSRPTAAYLHHVELDPIDGHLVPDPEVLFLANSAFAAARWGRLAGIHCHVVPPIVRMEGATAGTTGERVLFVNPVPEKGVELFFALAATCPEIPFTLLENWGLEPTWRDYCQRRAGALGNVEYLDRVDDMRPVYARSRVLLMPSVWEESFGRTVVEAQLNGLPVLASDRGALPEVVGPGGLTLSPHAPIEDWASALRGMHADPSPWSDAARAHAFAHAVMAPAIAAELLSLLATHALRNAPKSRAGEEALSRTATPAAAGDLAWRLARLAPTGVRRDAVAAEWRALAGQLASQRRLDDAEEAARKAIALGDN